MSGQLIEVRLADGSSTKFSVFANGERTSNAVCVLFPAMGTPASYYNVFAQALAEKGVICITADLRGIGNSSVRPKRGVDFGFNEMIELDYKGILEKVDSLYPGRRKFIIGHSLGGILGSLFVSKYPKAADGLILIAACNIYFTGWSGFRQLWILFGSQMMNFFASLFGYHAGNIVGFGGIGAKTVIKDWSYTARTGKYSVSNSNHDFERSLNGKSARVHAFSFSHDILAPRKAVENLLAKFNASSDITHRHLANVAPGDKPYSHYNWVKYNAEVTGMIVEWINSKA